MRKTLDGFSRKLVLFGIFVVWVLHPTVMLAQQLSLDMPDSPASNGSSSTIGVLLTGAFLGLIGQVARTVVGLKKETDSQPGAENWKIWFNSRELVVSLLLGAAAGTFAAVGLMSSGMDNKFAVACITAGYAGSDFIQGFMQNYGTPSSATPVGSKPGPTGEGPPKTTSDPKT